MKYTKVVFFLMFLCTVLIGCDKDEVVVVEEDLSDILGTAEDTEDSSEDESTEDTDSGEDTEDSSEDEGTEDTDSGEDAEDSSEDGGTEDTDGEEDAEETANISLKGNFISDAHPTSGVAQITRGQDGKLYLVFTDFKTDPGPDLDVYLATDTNAGDYINIGNLKGTEGQFAYEISEDIDIEKNNHVLIWCVSFSVNFGYAKLEKQ